MFWMRVVEPDQLPLADADGDDSPMLDATSTSELESEKKEKKHKKKRKLESDATLPVDTTSTAEPDVPKKKKSKKSKHTDDSPAHTFAEAEAPLEAEASSSNSEKKEKKSKSKKDKAQDTTAGTATSSPVTAPSQSEIDTYLSTHHISLSLPDSCSPSCAAPILSFSALLPLIPSSLHPVLAAFKDPTPIQACSWGPALAGKDVVGIAETGSGKTLAFGIPALSSLLSQDGTPSTKKSKKQGNSAGIQVLVLAPTRELAIQTHDTLSGALSATSSGLTSVAVFGGVDKNAQIRSLRSPGARIVVGTPGRVQDLMQDGSLDISGVRYLVLDEADRMLDKGFENDIRRIVGETPQEGRQTLMCKFRSSCTYRKGAKEYQQSAQRGRSPCGGLHRRSSAIQSASLSAPKTSLRTNASRRSSRCSTTRSPRTDASSPTSSASATLKRPNPDLNRTKTLG